MPIIGAMGAAIDYSMANAQRTAMQAAIDATALALVKIMPTSQQELNARGAEWFAASRHCDEKDRVVRKSDGEKTYLMSDIAYIKNKFDRGFETALYIWGADHHGYVPRIKSAAEALGYDPARVEVLIVQLVSIKGARMSKREGNIVYIDELLEEVGADAARFFFITRPRDTHVDFDMDLARDKSEANPLFYLQYAHARVCSILAKATEAGCSPGDEELDELVADSELDLLKLLADFPWEIQSAATSREPHRIINYLNGLATTFHGFYHNHKVIRPEEPRITAARLALCDAVRIVMRNGLALLGITAPEKM